VSERAWGWIGAGTGLLAILIGAWVTAAGTWSIGVGLCVIGSISFGTGLAMLAEPWAESTDEEIDRWEENWGSRWLPECPVHGEQLCHTRTKRCPEGVRERIP